MLNKLSGWTTLGIALSILWAFCAALHTYNDGVKSAKFWSKITYDTCSEAKQRHQETDLSTCAQERDVKYAYWLKASNGEDNSEVWSVAILPIPFGWLTGFILLYVMRAQVIGLRTVISWQTLSRSKKLFVSLCIAVGILYVFFFVILGLNAYVDSQVPVWLGEESVNQFNNHVTIEGTWERIDLTDDTIINPLQTSKIDCDKETKKCTEANAYVITGMASNILGVDSKEYNITSWTPASIVFQQDELCATTIFTVDLTTKTVSGAGHFINQGIGACGINAGSEQSWSYLLSDGSKVYQKQRVKAHPTLLKLFQAFFSN